MRTRFREVSEAGMAEGKRFQVRPRWIAMGPRTRTEIERIPQTDAHVCRLVRRNGQPCLALDGLWGMMPVALL